MGGFGSGRDWPLTTRSDQPPPMRPQRAPAQAYSVGQAPLQDLSVLIHTLKIVKVVVGPGCSRKPTTEHNIERSNAMPARISMIGKRFGSLIVIKELPDRHSAAGNPCAMSLCLCDCGNKTEVINTHLRRGNTKSCGIGLHRGTHGHSKKGNHSPTYRCWDGMIQRITNPKKSNFPFYGGRGITICERWLDFSNFLADMGEKPKGITATLGELCERFHACVDRTVAQSRLTMGWTLEASLFVPKKLRGRRKG